MMISKQQLLDVAAYVCKSVQTPEQVITHVRIILVGYQDKQQTLKKDHTDAFRLLAIHIVH